MGGAIRSFVETLTDDEQRLVADAKPYSIISPERLIANMDAVAYVVELGIPGALVECGVWRGGSALVMVKALQRAGVDDRDVYLFDTFEGMNEPTDMDTSRFSEPATTTWQKAKASGATAYERYFQPAKFSLDGVRSLLHATGYPSERIRCVPGLVEDTVPDRAPSEIAVLRLDTDWYESTKHELVHLYPRLASGGVLIIDDYGHWDGCRCAVDEYFSTLAPSIFLSRIDYTGRLGIKP